MQLFIKNMVCNRCKMMVEAELRKLGLTPIDIRLGEVEVKEKELSDPQQTQLADSLAALGFELLIDKKKQVVAQLKGLIIELVHYSENGLHINLSAYLGTKLEMSYTTLSTLFSEIENDTIEHFFIRQKIEKAKELLTYGEQSLSEIAYRLNYSSVAHLSAQFKKITSQTASAYKKAHHLKRFTLDEV